MEVHLWENDYTQNLSITGKKKGNLKMIKTCMVIIFVAIPRLLLGNSLVQQAMFHEDPDFKNIFFINSHNGYVVPYSSGHFILSTNDGGSHWSKIKLPDSSYSVAASILAPDTINLLVQPYLSPWRIMFLRSFDGGSTWLSDTTNFMNSSIIHFFDKNNGVIIGPKTWYTKNGGRSWTAENTPPYFGNEGKAFFLDSLHWWVTYYEGHKAYRTKDAGKSWDTCAFPNRFYDHMNSVFFFDSLSGWVANSGGIDYTSDGGTTWSFKFTPECTSMNDIFFINRQVGWAVGYKRLIYKTVDGGASWQKQICPLPVQQLHSVFMLDSMNGFVVGDNGALLKTVNSGATWTSDSFSVSSILQNLAFVSNKTGYLVGGGDCGMSICLKTIDEGKTWHELALPENPIISGICFLNENVGWMCGYGGVIEYTENGGQDWKILVHRGATDTNLYDIHFVDSANGWAVGNIGRILRTSDGGSHWTLQTSGTSSFLRRIHLINKDRGWVIGDTNFVLETTNGGTLWSENVSITHANDIFFIDTIHGWISCDSNVYRTNDGGNSWKKVPIKYPKSSNSVWDLPFKGHSIAFKDPRCGLVNITPEEDPYGYYAVTTDSGNTWQVDSLKGRSGLLYLCYSDTATLWGVSEYWKTQLYRITLEGLTSTDASSQRYGASSFISPKYSGNTEKAEIAIYNLKGCLILKDKIEGKAQSVDINKFLKQAGHLKGTFIIKVNYYSKEPESKRVTAFKRLVIMN